MRGEPEEKEVISFFEGQDFEGSYKFASDLIKLELERLILNSILGILYGSLRNGYIRFERFPDPKQFSTHFPYNGSWVQPIKPHPAERIATGQAGRIALNLPDY